MIEPHLDDGDIYTVYLTLGSLTEGGGSMFFGIDKNLNYTSVDFQNYNIFMGRCTFSTWCTTSTYTRYLSTEYHRHATNPCFVPARPLCGKGKNICM